VKQEIHTAVWVRFKSWITNTWNSSVLNITCTIITN